MAEVPGDPLVGDDHGQEPEDAAAAALARARLAAREKGLRPGLRPIRGSRAGRRAAAARRDDDGRDPHLLGDQLDRLMLDRGWQVDVAVGSVMGRWPQIVGAEVAQHCAPVTFEAGVLTVRADSTAWATQVRLLTAGLLRRLAEEVGEGTVTKVVVRGPSGPSWRRGPRVAPGSQGPRDTYG